ncbi:MAG: SMC family ATPase, partial [Acidobacteriota bacterium]
MLITKVQISNIKNYTEKEFNFESGVTAICGPNGVGKTTIIEAIAWVLFDHLDYKREDFLRRGARKGSVNVAFVSKLDGRSYSVFRDTTGNYYAYDPVLKTRIAQQKQEVVRWLCQQLGVEPGTDLSALFRSTIGVPQGTFTFDFAQVPSKRKPIFDKILKVEEYIKASDELRELLRHIEQRVAEIREQIASDEGELKRYDEITSEHVVVSNRLEKLSRQLADVELEKRAADVKVERLDTAKAKLDQIVAQLQAIEIELVQKTEREKSLAAELERSRDAAAQARDARPGYDTYQAASRQLQELERERTRRDERRAVVAITEQELTRLEVNLKHHREALAQIEHARVEMESLTAALSEQEGLELQLRELERKFGEKEQVERMLSKLGHELDELRNRYSDLSKDIDEAEQHKDAAQQVARLQTEHQSLSLRLRDNMTKLGELKNKQIQLAAIQADCLKWQQERDSLMARITILRRTADIPEPIAELEASYRQVSEEVAQYRAFIERDERMLKEIKGGLCPLLSQRCLNLREGQSLDGHFKFQLSEYRTALAQRETTYVGLDTRLQRARAAISAQSTLEPLQAQLVKLEADLSEHRRLQERLSAETATLGELEEILHTATTRLQTLEAELAVAREGVIKYEKLEPKRVRLNELKTEGMQKRRLYDAENARLTALMKEIADKPALETRLVRLGNPRATIESLRRQVAREPHLRTELMELEREQQSVAERLTALQSELAQWAGLDEELMRVNGQLANSRTDYDRFITNQGLAEQLPALQQQVDSLRAEITTVKRQQERVSTEHRTANVSYSLAEHNQARSALEELIRQAAELGAELKHTEAQQTQLQIQLDELAEVKRRQADKIARRDRLHELQGLAEFIRECLKKAGPYITEAYLHTISREANQLYRDISGNSLVSLRWENDYEIVLEEEGRDRPFNNLSGGEQMAAALSVRLALLKEFSDLRFAFFDEPTTNMDEERRRNLAQQIGRIKDFEQLFVISHD